MKTISQNKFSHMLSRLAAENDIPVSGSFELTPLCNFDCRMCYIHRSDAAVRERMLAGGQWIEIMDGAIAGGMMTALLTGGEALTHPDFWRIYEHLIGKGIFTTLKTNGFLLNADTIAHLKEYMPRSVDVSLYGCDDDSYEAVTGRRVFETVRTNLLALKESGIGFRLMITPSRYMLPWVEDVMLLAREFDVKVVVNTMMIEPGDGVGNRMEDYNITVDDEIRIAKRAHELFPKERMSLSEEEEIYGKPKEREPDARKAAEKRTGLKCNGGRTGFAVGWDGVMTPCLEYPRELVSAYPLRDGFAAAWRTVNGHVKAFAEPEECGNCPIRNACHYCPTMHGRSHAAGRTCNRSVCSFWMRAADELPKPERKENR